MLWSAAAKHWEYNYVLNSNLFWYIHRGLVCGCVILQIYEYIGTNMYLMCVYLQENRTDFPDPHPIDFSYSLIFNSPHYKMCSDLFTHSSEGRSEPELIQRGWGERVLLLERWELRVLWASRDFTSFCHMVVISSPRDLISTLTPLPWTTCHPPLSLTPLMPPNNYLPLIPPLRLQTLILMSNYWIKSYRPLYHLLINKILGNSQLL